MRRDVPGHRGGKHRTGSRRRLPCLGSGEHGSDASLVNSARVTVYTHMTSLLCDLDVLRQPLDRIRPVTRLTLRTPRPSAREYDCSPTPARTQRSI